MSCPADGSKTTNFVQFWLVQSKKNHHCTATCSCSHRRPFPWKVLLGESCWRDLLERKARETYCHLAMFSIPGMVTSAFHFCTVGNPKLKRIFYKRLLFSKKQMQQIMQWKAAYILSNAYLLNNLIFLYQETKASAAFLEKEKSWLCYQNCHTDTNGFHLLLHPQSWVYLPVSVRVLPPSDCSGGSCTQ